MLLPLFKVAVIFLAGDKNATSGQLMDSMYSSWNLDPVHGEKVA